MSNQIPLIILQIFPHATLFFIDVKIIITFHILSSYLLEAAHAGPQKPIAKFSGIL